jgi:hypothetical protein
MSDSIDNTTTIRVTIEMRDELKKVKSEFNLVTATEAIENYAKFKKIKKD